MTINLKDKERLDELQRNGYQIIQNPEKFCFGMDAVLLSGFAKAKKGDVVLDMGTGTGIIPILMEAKTEAAHLIGLEIQEESADMARRSVALNGLSEKIDINTDLMATLSEQIEKQGLNLASFEDEFTTKVQALFDSFVSNTQSHLSYEKSIATLNAENFRQGARISKLEDYFKGSKILATN